MDKKSKEEVIKSLRKDKCYKLANLVSKNLVSPDDCIVNPPMCNAYETHLNLEYDIKDSQNPGQKSYEGSAIKQAENLISIFNMFYPGVDIQPPVMRKKSQNSLRGKMKNLEIERISKLYGIYADTLGDTSSTEYKKKIDDYFEKNGVEFDLHTLESLIDERINESIYLSSDQSIGLRKSEIDEIQAEQREQYKEMIHKLLDPKEEICYEDLEQFLLTSNDDLSESETSNDITTSIDSSPTSLNHFSSSTKKALAKMIYYRIKTDEKGLIRNPATQSLKEYTLNDDLRKNLSSNLEENYPSFLAKSSLTKYHTKPSESWENEVYDGQYKEILDRILNPQEFMRSKDMYGMQIIINNIPKKYSIDGNNEFNFLVSQRDLLLKVMERIDDKKSDSYKKLLSKLNFFNQKCIQSLSRDFMNKLLQNKLPKRATNITNIKDFTDATNSKIIPYSLHDKEKPNGYTASHIKFELEANPLHTLELQVKSSQVYAKSKGNGSASHAHRPGKQRIVPSIVEKASTSDENINLNDLSRLDHKKEAIRFADELSFLVPQFYVYDGLHFKKENALSNCYRFYEDFANNRILETDSREVAMQKGIEYEKFKNLSGAISSIGFDFSGFNEQIHDINEGKSTDKLKINTTSKLPYITEDVTNYPTFVGYKYKLLELLLSRKDVAKALSKDSKSHEKDDNSQISKNNSSPDFKDDSTDGR